MDPCIDIIGLGADGAAGLRPELVERILAADFLVGGQRHLSHFPTARGQRRVLENNVESVATELARRCVNQRCVVLASGDPLFYGIGTRLVNILGSLNVRIEPALSSMQLAFARAGISWQNAALASIHGRPLRPILLPLLGQTPIGLFTQDGDSPAAVARFFLRHGLRAYEAIVGENLGTAGERVSRWAHLSELIDQRFEPLNYLILWRTHHSVPLTEVTRHRALVPGIPDSAFVRPAEGPPIMTGQEVRSVLLGKLLEATQPGDVFWDIGAGLGTMSVEVAVLRPHLEVVAVEQDQARFALLCKNRALFGAYNVRVVAGSAPEALHDEPERPRLVFLGGSGGRLSAILDLVAERLVEGGRLVAAFVTLEHLLETLQRLRGWGWSFEVTEVQIARSDPLGSLTGLKPQRGVFLVRADRPASSRRDEE